MESSKVQLHHKEESKARIEADRKDRDGLRNRLDLCIDPLDPKQHPDIGIVNIVSGKITPAFVNVEKSVLIGEGMLEDYEKTWPEGFYSTISKKVETMGASRKSVQIGDSKVYDLNAIYSRVIALLSSDRNIECEGCLLLWTCTCPNGNVLGKRNADWQIKAHTQEVDPSRSLSEECWWCRYHCHRWISSALDCTLAYRWLRSWFHRECQEKDSFIPDKQWRLSHLWQISWV